MSGFLYIDIMLKGLCVTTSDLMLHSRRIFTIIPCQYFLARSLTEHVELHSSQGAATAAAAAAAATEATEATEATTTTTTAAAATTAATATTATTTASAATEATEATTTAAAACLHLMFIDL